MPTLDQRAAIVAEVLRHQRACRSFTDEPVDEATLATLLELATRAPSAQNLQPWQFVVVRDPERRRRVWTLAARVWEMGGADASRGTVPDEMHADVAHGVTGGFAGAPVTVVVGFDTERGDRATMASSIWPAVQNLMIAATAHGLGSALTTIATFLADDLRAEVGLPETIEPVAVIPLGHPATRLGSSRREPVEDHAHREEYGRGW